MFKVSARLKTIGAALSAAIFFMAQVSRHDAISNLATWYSFISWIAGLASISFIAWKMWPSFHLILGGNKSKDQRQIYLWNTGWIRLQTALIAAYAELKNNDLFIVHAAEREGGATKDQVLNFLAEKMIDNKNEIYGYIHIRGKNHISGAIEIIDENDAVRGRFQNEGNKFGYKNKEWTDLEVTKTAWDARLEKWISSGHRGSML
jgi:hypothetical protein